MRCEPHARYDGKVSKTSCETVGRELCILSPLFILGTHNQTSLRTVIGQRVWGKLIFRSNPWGP